MVLDRVGLTGATGMLGRHIQTVFENSSVDILPVSRLSDNPSTKWDLGKWLNTEELDNMFSSVQAIIHAGAFVQTSGEINHERMFDVNVRACLNLGQWALKKNIPMVYVSTASVYANPYKLSQDELSELGWGGLGGFYSFSKLLAEDILIRLNEQGLKVAIIRPTSIYGYGIDKEKMVSRFLNTALADRVIELIEPIEDKVDLIHAADVANIVLAILEHESWDIFNVSSGYPVSIIELAKECVGVAGCGGISVGGKRHTNYQSKVTCSLDTTRAQERLGWQPEIDIRKGLEMLLNRQYAT